MSFNRKGYKFPKLSHWARVTLISLSIWLLCSLLPIIATSQESPSVLFDEVWETVNQNFYDPKFNGVDWRAMKEKYEPQVENTKSVEEVAIVINQMLSELKTSHTRLYTQAEPAYYQLLGIFDGYSELQQKAKKHLPNGKLEYSGIGAFTKEIEGKTFAIAILDDSPAAKAGLKVGDEILEADGKPYQPIKSFQDKVGQKVKLLVRRTADPNSPEEIAIEPKIYNATQMFLEAQKASVEIIEKNDRKIGYIHIWSRVSNERDLRQFEEELIYGRLKGADGLVLDLRDGWGGVDMGYLRLFAGKSPDIVNTSRDGSRNKISYDWEKPVVALVNEGTRSAKEILAFAFQKYNIGKVVGSKTAGYVVAGRPFLMKDGNLLYLAVVDVSVDGERLEGKGVTPDISVPSPIPYAQGADPQKQRAIEVVLEAIS
ncbi:periplasmic protease [Pleurocapsa sp. PCC 7327]|uniref:S41 family peptidase n=1 Tax=Pleurocapsa sp. PCC 7327 TaxID=118163 RepID=UPI00029F971A|nr:periplasmic protease [Pleurocapsa sp. PCC 7327]